MVQDGVGGKHAVMCEEFANKDGFAFSIQHCHASPV